MHRHQAQLRHSEGAELNLKADEGPRCGRNRCRHRTCSLVSFNRGRYLSKNTEQERTCTHRRVCERHI